MAFVMSCSEVQQGLRKDAVDAVRITEEMASSENRTGTSVNLGHWGGRQTISPVGSGSEKNSDHKASVSVGCQHVSPADFEKSFWHRKEAHVRDGT